jgi:acyl carrier protein
VVRATVQLRRGTVVQGLRIPFPPQPRRDLKARALVACRRRRRARKQVQEGIGNRPDAPAVVHRFAPEWKRVTTVPPWNSEFERILREHLPFLAQGDVLEPERPLQLLGLDSLETVQLMLELEDAFEMSFPDEYLDAATWSTTGSIWRALDGLMTRADLSS